MFSLQLSCSQLKAHEIDAVVVEFVSLLVSDEEVSLSDYEKFYGQSSERELLFELKICEEKEWDINSTSCISFIRDRWRHSETEASLFIAWVKERFLTTGASYEFISSTPSDEGFQHSLIEVLIGDHRFVLFQNTSLGVPTGTLVGITSIDGQSVQSYFTDN